MKRVLFLLLGITVALTLFGLLFAFTRPIKWPAGIRPLEWRRATESAEPAPKAEEGEEVA